jgi:hypothetical protein
MPSKTPAQKRLMAAAAHTPGGFGGVPQKVGREFFSADQAQKHEKGGVIEPISKATTPAKKHGWRRW